MLDAADVQVDAAGVVRAVLGRPRTHPVRLVLLGAQLFCVVRVGVAQLVPGAARPLRHHVGVAGVGLAGRRRGPVRRSPSRSPWPAAATARCRRRRDRTAPARSPGRPAAPPAAPTPAAGARGRRRRRRSGTARPSTAAGRTASRAACTRRGPGRGPSASSRAVIASLADGDAQPVRGSPEFTSSPSPVYGLCEMSPPAIDLDDRQPELGGELPVALVVAGHRHDRAGAVARQHVVGDEHRDLLPVGRIASHTRRGTRRSWPCSPGAPGRTSPRSPRGRRRRPRRASPRRRSSAGRRPSGHCVGGQRVDQLVLGRQHHVRRAEQRVRPGGEHLDVAGVGAEQHRRHRWSGRSSCAAWP